MKWTLVGIALIAAMGTYPDGKGQLQICKQKKIEGYPTWEFADGSRETGEVSLATLAEKIGCMLVE